MLTWLIGAGGQKNIESIEAIEKINLKGFLLKYVCLLFYEFVIVYRKTSLVVYCPRTVLLHIHGMSLITCI